MNGRSLSRAWTFHRKKPLGPKNVSPNARSPTNSRFMNTGFWQNTNCLLEICARSPKNTRQTNFCYEAPRGHKLMQQMTVQAGGPSGSQCGLAGRMFEQGGEHAGTQSGTPFGCLDKSGIVCREYLSWRLALSCRFRQAIWACHGCCWETFYIFAYCGLVVEIQIH